MPGFDPYRGGLRSDDELEASRVGIDSDQTSANGQTAVQSELPWYEELMQAGDKAPAWSNALKGGIEGATFNHAGELGEFGQDLGNAAADVTDWLTGEPERDVQPGGGEDMEALYDLATSTPEGALAQTAVLAGHGAALGGAAPASLLGRSAAGGMSGYMAAEGATGDDALSELAGTGFGAMTGGLSHAASKGLEAAKRYVFSDPKRAAEIAKAVQFKPTELLNPGTMIANALSGGAATGLKASARAGYEALKHGVDKLPPYLGGAAAPLPSALMSRDKPTMEVGEMQMLSELMGPTSEASAQYVDQPQQWSETELVSPPPGTPPVTEVRPHAGQQGVEIRPEDWMHANLNPEKDVPQPWPWEWDETELVKPDPNQLNIDIGEAEQLEGYDSSGIGEAKFREPISQIGDAQIRPPMSSIGEAVFMPKAHAQDVDIGEAQIKAWAGMPSLDYAMKQTLSAGSGLSPTDEAQLTRALTTGDSDKVKTLHHKFSQRYPAYQKRVQAQLDALNAQE